VLNGSRYKYYKDVALHRFAQTGRLCSSRKLPSPFGSICWLSSFCNFGFCGVPFVEFDRLILPFGLLKSLSSIAELSTRSSRSSPCSLRTSLGSSIPFQFSGAANCVGQLLAEATVTAEAFPGEPLFLVDPVILGQLMDPFARAQIEPEDVACIRPLPIRSIPAPRHVDILDGVHDLYSH
jgi:hypothetical protein